MTNPSLSFLFFGGKLQHSDMNEEMRTEAMELCVTACEKFSSNNEVTTVVINDMFIINFT